MRILLYRLARDRVVAAILGVVWAANSPAPAGGATGRFRAFSISSVTFTQRSSCRTLDNLFSGLEGSLTA